MFKVGDKVWCAIMGWGEVTEVTTDSVVVFFSEHVYLRYTDKGKRYEDGLRVLFFSEIPTPPSALERPKWRAEKGHRCYRVNADGEIVSSLDHYTDYDDRLHKFGNYFQNEEEAKESKFYKVFHGEEKDV